MTSMLAIGAIISVSSGLGYLLPAIIGLESMGVPSPGETALILAAVLASQGHLQIWLVIVIASASAIAGDNIGYLLGRKLGRRVLMAPGPLHHRRLRVIEAGGRFFQKHGPKAVFLGRWVALLRFAIAWLAGIEHMRFRTFFVYNALGGITWATAYGLVGYYLGKAAADAITHYGIYAAVVIAVLAVAWIAFALWRERRAGAGDEPSSASEEPPVLGGGADAAAGGDTPLGPADDQA